MCLKITSFSSQTCLVPGKQTINQTGNVRTNVTTRRVRATIVAVEGNKYYIFRVHAFSLGYPACKAHVPYCHLWSLRLYNIFFPHYLINGTILEKKSYLTKKIYFDSFYKFCLKHFSS